MGFGRILFAAGVGVSIPYLFKLYKMVKEHCEKTSEKTPDNVTVSTTTPQPVFPLYPEEKYGFKGKSEYRMMLVVRNDLKMGKGKIAAQCCHAAVMSYKTMTTRRPYLEKPWKQNGTAKIAVKVDSEDELLAIEQKAKELKILTRIVRDAGHTQIAPMTRTVLSLGPAPKEVLDQVTGHLKLL